MRYLVLGVCVLGAWFYFYLPRGYGSPGCERLLGKVVKAGTVADGSVEAIRSVPDDHISSQVGFAKIKQAEYKLSLAKYNDACSRSN